MKWKKNTSLSLYPYIVSPATKEFYFQVCGKNNQGKIFLTNSMDVEKNSDKKNPKKQKHQRFEKKVEDFQRGKRKNNHQRNSALSIFIF